MKPGALIIVAMVDPATVPTTFRRKRLEWPLHVTIAPWFTVPDETKMIRFLESNLLSEPSFIAEIGDDTTFGEDGSIAVSLVANPQRFNVLHNYLLEYIRDNEGAIFVNTWTGDAYRPHVTHHGDNRLYGGDSFAVQSLTLVRLADDEWCEVVANFSLGEMQ